MPSSRGRRRHQLRRLQQQGSTRRGQKGSELAGPCKDVISERIVIINDPQDVVDGEVTVSRSMPTVLSGRMDGPSWTSFCDEVDNALKPVTKIKKALRNQALASAAAIVPLFLFVGVTVAGESPMSSIITKIFLLLYGLTIAGIILMSVRSMRSKAKVNEGLLKACDKASASHAGISFEICPELQYIEICPSKDQDGALEEGDAQPGPASEPNSFGDAPADAAEAGKWRAAVDRSTNRTYYYNEETGEATWEKPSRFDGADAGPRDGADGTAGGGKTGEVAAAESKNDEESRRRDQPQGERTWVEHLDRPEEWEEIEEHMVEHDEKGTVENLPPV